MKKFRYIISFLIIFIVVFCSAPVVFAENTWYFKYWTYEQFVKEHQGSDIPSKDSFPAIHNMAQLHHDTCDFNPECNKYGSDYINIGCIYNRNDGLVNFHNNYVYKFLVQQTYKNGEWAKVIVFSDKKLYIGSDSIYAFKGTNVAYGGYNILNGLNHGEEKKYFGMIKENEYGTNDKKLVSLISAGNVVLCNNGQFVDSEGNEFDNDIIGDKSPIVTVIPERFGMEMDYTKEINVNDAYVALKVQTFEDCVVSVLVSELSDNQVNGKRSYRAYTEKENSNRFIFRLCSKDFSQIYKPASNNKYDYLFLHKTGVETYCIPYSYLNIKPNKQYFLHLFISSVKFMESENSSANMLDDLTLYKSYAFSFKDGSVPTYTPPEYGDGGSSVVNSNAPTEIKKPGAGSNILDWFDYWDRSSNALFKGVTNSISNVYDSTNSVFAFIGSAFSFLPKEIWLVLTCGIGIALILRILGR
ncbi:hypothetical protein RBG61_01450 [Paludicola sp. MB14-C6]|uniref:hypothetical protein n=1 Tax=Paludihabitans sp. MB14-C6 TaxID=3070656 RepID=UPI0027DB04BD|nr:hypothetical protein [Paludicola sp. MB14-C6]WMJ23355.1 hypothetical protein RBG61_01450 [Paludicola sp. MB14-C6]